VVPFKQKTPFADESFWLQPQLRIKYAMRVHFMKVFVVVRKLEITGTSRKSKRHERNKNEVDYSMTNVSICFFVPFVV